MRYPTLERVVASLFELFMWASQAPVRPSSGRLCQQQRVPGKFPAPIQVPGPGSQTSHDFSRASPLFSGLDSQHTQLNDLAQPPGRVIQTLIWRNYRPRAKPKSKPCTRLSVVHALTTSSQGSISKKLNLEPDTTQTFTRLIYRQVHLFRTGGQPAPSEENERPRARSKPKPCTRVVWTGPTGSRLEGLQATSNLNKHKRPRARPSPNLAPAWSRQVQKT